MNQQGGAGGEGWPGQMQPGGAWPPQEAAPPDPGQAQPFPGQPFPQAPMPGAPPQQPYGAPGYGAPAQQPSYGAPQQQPGYGAPPPAQQPYAPPGYGAPAQQPPYGAPQQQPGYGAPAPAPLPYGAPPGAPAPHAPYGAPPAGVDPNLPYGTPPIAPGAQMPAGQPQLPAAGQTAAAGGLGFDLNPDERVLWAVKRSYTGEKIAFWILGVLFAVVLIGLFFIYRAVTMEAKSPRGLVLTNRRLVVLEGSGAVSAFWLNQYVDLTPQRAQARAGGGGLVGALVSVAVSAGLNALANRNEKTTSAYWARTIAVMFKQHDGKQVSVAVLPAEGVILGPMLARCILMNEADTLPPYDARTFSVSAGAQPGGVGMFIGGGVLMFFAALFGYTGVNRFAWGVYGAGAVITVVSLGMLAGAGALFFAGARRGWQTAEAQGKKPNKILPLAIPGAIFLVLSLPILGSGVATFFNAKKYRSSYDSSYTTKPKATQTAAPTSTLSTAGGSLSPGAIESVFLSEGYRFGSTGRAEKLDFAGSTSWGWFMSHPSRPMLWAKLYELPEDSTEGPAFKSYSADRQLIVIVNLTGSGGTTHKSQALNAAILSKAPTSPKDLSTALTGSGWKLSTPMLKEHPYAFGNRTYLAFAKKGALSATVHVQDFSPAASGSDIAAAKVFGQRALIVSAGKHEFSQALLDKLSK